jgi:hypothetical protein
MGFEGGSGSEERSRGVKSLGINYLNPEILSLNSSFLPNSTVSPDSINLELKESLKYENHSRAEFCIPILSEQVSKNFPHTVL